MDCQECKKLLSEFLDNELEKKQQVLMIKHIEDCPACAQSLESISEMVNIMHKIKGVNPPDDLINKVNGRLDALSFWNKVFLGIRNFFFSNRPIKSFALLVTLVLVFAVTAQLNMLPSKKGALIAKEQEMLLKEQSSNVHESSLGDYADGVSLKSARYKSLAKKEENCVQSAGAAIEGFSLAKSSLQLDSDETNSLILEDKPMSMIDVGKKDSRQYQKQILLLTLDRPMQFDEIEKMLSDQKAQQIVVSKTKNHKLFFFVISYENFLKLHSVLAGIGQIEKQTPDSNFEHNINREYNFNQQNFEVKIPVKLIIEI